MTPSEIKGIKYSSLGDKVYSIGQKFVRVFQCLDLNFKVVENIEVPTTLTELFLAKNQVYGISLSTNKILLLIQRPKSVQEKRVEERIPSPIKRIPTEQEE